MLRQREYSFRPETYSENRPANNRGNDRFEAASVDWKLGFEDWTFMVQDRASPRGDGAKRARRPARGHLPDSGESFAHAVRPERGIRVQKYVFGPIIGQEFEN